MYLIRENKKIILKRRASLSDWPRRVAAPMASRGWMGFRGVSGAPLLSLRRASRGLRGLASSRGAPSSAPSDLPLLPLCLGLAGSADWSRSGRSRGMRGGVAAFRALRQHDGGAFSSSSASARTVVLVTQRLDTVGEMACNPAIGRWQGHSGAGDRRAQGPDGSAADAGAIHFTVLNRSRGPAVRGPRVQCDRGMYRRRSSKSCWS